METLQIAKRIEGIISEIGKFRREIEKKGNTRAKSISAYDKQMQVSIVTLREEGKFPATLIEKIAKGLCSPQIEAREIAESNYKACISNLNALMAQLNGYQSIYRHLDET